jgi:hypothetical protein
MAKTYQLSYVKTYGTLSAWTRLSLARIIPALTPWNKTVWTTEASAPSIPPGTTVKRKLVSSY